MEAIYRNLWRFDTCIFSSADRRPDLSAGYGIEWNGKWNGMEILVWNMEDAVMEWKVSRMEWKAIFHTSIPIPY